MPRHRLLAAIAVVVLGSGYVAWMVVRPVDHGARGFEALSAGHNREAIAEFQEALRKSPKNPSLHFNLGIAYERMGSVGRRAPVPPQQLHLCGHGGQVTRELRGRRSGLAQHCPLAGP